MRLWLLGGVALMGWLGPVRGADIDWAYLCDRSFPCIIDELLQGKPARLFPRQSTDKAVS